MIDPDSFILRERYTVHEMRPIDTERGTHFLREQDEVVVAFVFSAERAEMMAKSPEMLALLKRIQRYILAEQVSITERAALYADLARFIEEIGGLG